MKRSILVIIAFFFFTSFLFSQTIQWEQPNGPFGGTALSFVTYPNGDMFAGSGLNDLGVYFSSDEGSSWQRKNNGISLDRSINCITIADSGHLIIGTNSSNGSRIYKSTDYGESWFAVTLFGASCFTINSSGHIYAGYTAHQTMHISTDNGNSWVAYSVPESIVRDITINDSDHVFITGGTSWRSTDYGATWTQLNIVTSGLPNDIGSIAITGEGDLLAGCYSNDSRMGVYKSTDNGDNWIKIKSDIKVEAHGNIVIKNNGDIFVGSSGQGVWKSTDNGTTWTQHNAGLHHLDVRSMHISSNGIICAGLNGGGIYKSTDDGETWSQVGLTAGTVVKIAISPINGNLYSANPSSGMSRSTDSGQSWQPINTGLGNWDITSIEIKPDGIIFLGCAGTWYLGLPRVLRSTDNGDTWVQTDNGLQNVRVESMTIDADGNIYAGGHENGVYKSTNNGDSWVNIGGAPFAKALQFNSSGDLFLASYGQGFWKLPAGDTIWLNLTSNIGASWIWTMFIDSRDYIYADGKRSTDNGNSWLQMNGIQSSVSSFTENSIGHLFCGTFNFGSGIFLSTDHGDNWTAINTGLPTMDIRSIAVDSDDYLYAGTNGYSMVKTTTSTVTSVEEERYTPSSFSLEQNYPNPFNPSTVIGYRLPVSGSVTLKVYDLLGRQIATLVDEYKPAGRYEVEFNASELSSGVYLFRIKTGSYVNTKKMILLR